MNTSLRSNQGIAFHTTALAACLLLSGLLAPAQTAPSGPGYTVTDLGPFYRVWQMTVSITNPVTGLVTQSDQGYTELGNGIAYSG